MARPAETPTGRAGYGAVLQFVDKEGTLHEKELSAGYVKTTNNRMELMAVIVGLEALNQALPDGTLLGFQICGGCV